MNILIPYTWLLEHLDTKATPEKLQECLSLCGPSVERIDSVNGEPVFDVEITTNRVDSMSVRGIAREAAAILPEFDIKAKLKTLTTPKVSSQLELGIRIKNNPQLCRRILAVKLENLKIKPSPGWLQKRLTQVGQRPLNNTIDITNYVMWELGHPIHVFDFDRLKEKTIIVREAKKGEKLITLDNKTYTLNGGEVIFDDGTGNIIDLPGIMGTKNTVVTQKTKNILLWTESIDARKIRDASMGLAIRSQAAILNEKNVDPELAMPAILRAIELYKQEAQAQISSKIVDIYPEKPKTTSIKLPQKKLTTYLGLTVPTQKVKRILSALGCKVEINQTKKETLYQITPPTWRTEDLQIPHDLIEEIARIYGYHNLPSKLMAGKIPTKTQGITFHLEDSIKANLADWQLTEVYTYSLVKKELANLSEYKLNNHLKLSNPLTEDHVFLRRSILPSHLEVIKNNPQKEKVRIFELANVYHPKKGSQLPQEKQQLAITLTQDFFKAKALVEMLLKKLRVEYQFLPKNGIPKMLHPDRSAIIVAGNKIIGKIGEIKPSILRSSELKPPVTSVVFNTKNLLKSRTSLTYQPVPKHPPLVEDLTFVLADKTYVGELIEEITNLSRLIESVELKEVYQKNSTFTIIYRHPSRSLTDKDISPIRKKIKKHLYRLFKARLVGKI
jgi:phenylalanyl-tRNA synthetase beta chain